ncbi:MAG: succinate dehydrogenase, cytochrome b556 subunit [Steroidobacteraceae bacterium]|jgi:succinate dehydrogenase / fumarate reductase cytochrome b subunit|nr:succinate dehydrogenase, cytochrome b556 subunit [Steroidobacteraceae bacterium]
MRERPLSPHLSVWKFTTSMAMSITNRITGVILSVGLLLLAWWLMAAATSPSAYEGATRVLSHGFVQFLLGGWLLSFAYHLCNGIRHLTWDMGLGMERHETRRSGVVTLVATVVITLAIGYLAFFARGAS